MSMIIDRGDKVVVPTVLPNQRVSSKAKKKKDFYIPTINFVVAQAQAHSNKSVLEKRLKAAKGIIDDDVYQYVLNPYNTDSELLKEFPGELRNYDMIIPILERYVGEYIRGRDSFLAKVNNSDAIYRKTKELNEVITKMATQQYINMLEVETGADNQNVPDIGEFVAEFKSNWIDERAIEAKDALDAIRDWQDMDDKQRDMFINLIIFGETYSYTEVNRDDVTYEVVSPLEFYPIGNGNKYVEDQDRCCRISLMSVDQILNKFRDDLKTKDIKFLEELVKHSIVGKPTFVPYEYLEGGDLRMDSTGSTEGGLFSASINSEQVYVHHAVLTSKVKVGILTYTNELGQEDEREVDEDYILDTVIGDIDIEWVWLNQLMHGWRIGNTTFGIYIPLRPVEVQRNELGNSSKVKNPYNGITSISGGTFITSIVERLLPYAALRNIYELQLERAVAKYDGNMLIMPESLVSKASKHMTSAKRILYAKMDGKFYVDDSKASAINAIGAIKSVALGDAQYIVGMRNLITSIEEAAMRGVNMNDQRYGDIDSSAGKGTTEEAIQRSSTGSILLFESFNRLREKDYEGVIDFSKVAWADRAQDNEELGSFVTTDGIKQLTISQDYLLSNIGIHIKNRSIEANKQAALKDLAFAMGQNGNFDVAVEALESDNTIELRNFVKQAHKLNIEREQANSQSERDNNMQIAQLAAQEKQAERDSKEKIASDKNQTTIDVKLIEVNAELASSQSTGEGNIDSIAKEASDSLRAITDQSLKQRELDIKEADSIRKDITMNKRINADVKIATVNKN